jgi:predicted  nucleic acid-binding Zn-ribbon protein
MKEEIISFKQDTCPKCDTLLERTGYVKLLSPPLQVVHCPKCDVDYLRASK